MSKVAPLSIGPLPRSNWRQEEAQIKLIKQSIDSIRAGWSQADVGAFLRIDRSWIELLLISITSAPVSRPFNWHILIFMENKRIQFLGGKGKVLQFAKMQR
jgi:hypothetical protein